MLDSRRISNDLQVVPSRPQRPSQQRHVALTRRLHSFDPLRQTSVLPCDVLVLEVQRFDVVGRGDAQFADDTVQMVDLVLQPSVDGAALGVRHRRVVRRRRRHHIRGAAWRRRGGTVLRHGVVSSGGALADRLPADAVTVRRVAADEKQDGAETADPDVYEDRVPDGETEEDDGEEGENGEETDERNEGETSFTSGQRVQRLHSAAGPATAAAAEPATAAAAEQLPLPLVSNS